MANNSENMLFDDLQLAPDYDKLRDELRDVLKDFMDKNPAINVIAVGVGWELSEIQDNDREKSFSGLIIPKGSPMTLQQVMQVFSSAQGLEKHAATMLAQSAQALSIEKKMLEAQVNSLAGDKQLGEPPSAEDLQAAAGIVEE